LALRSPNILRNSTFKQCTNGAVPDFWAVSVYNRPGWREDHFRIDEESPIPDTQSVRLAVPAEITVSWHTAQCHRPYTFSCYLKSELETHAVTFRLGTQHYIKKEQVLLKDVTVGQEWKRYTFTGAPKRGAWFGPHWDVMILAVISKSKGVLKMAAPQLEWGKRPTPYQPADADVFVAAKIEEQVTFPIAECPRVTEEPKLSSVPAETDLPAGPLVDGFDASPVPEQYRTTFQAYHDDYLLFVIVRCSDPQAGEIKPRAKPIDPEWKILYEDSVWLCVKPDFDDRDYFVFGVTPGGRRCDSADYWFSWDRTEWKVTTEKRKDCWLAKYTVPFHIILQATGGRAIGETMGINARRLRRTRDGSDGGLARQMWFWSPDRAIRLPAAFGKLTGIDTRSVRACRIRDARLAFTGKGQTSAIVEIDHTPRLEEQGELALELVPPNGEVAKSVTSVPLDGRPQTVRVSQIPLEWQDGDWRLVVTVRDRTGRAIGRCTRRVFVPETLRLLDSDLIATIERSYYTDEERTHLLVESQLAKPLKVSVSLAGDDPKSLTKRRVSVPPKGRAVVPVVLKGLPDGRHRLCVTARDRNAREVAQASEVLEKLPPAPEGKPEIKIDRFRHFLLVDGRPVMPIGLFTALETEMDPARFNTVVGGLGKGKAVKEKGMMLQPYMGGWAGVKDVKKTIQQMDTLGNVIAWQFIDEPGPEPEKKVQGIYRQAKELDPYRIAYYLCGEWPNDAYQRGPGGIPMATDVVGISIYPWGMCGSSLYTLGQKWRYGLRTNANLARVFGHLIRKHGWAGYFNLQTYSGGEQFRHNTPEDNRCQVYLGLVHGVRMFSWFMNRPLADNLWNSFRDLKKELDTLTDILGDFSAFEDDRGEIGAAHYSLWQSKGEYYLLLANPSVRPATFRYELPDSVSGRARRSVPLFQGDPKPTPSRRALTVELGPYGSGAYLVR